jgi:ribonuclease HI
MSALQSFNGTWLKLVLNSVKSDMVDAILFTAWRAWFAHNECTHDKPLPSVEGSKRFLLSYSNTFKQVRELSTEEILKGKQAIGGSNPSLSIAPTAHVTKSGSWAKPMEGWVKLNCDGSFSGKDGAAGTGMILRDETGSTIVSACRQLFDCSNALEAEAYACLEGLGLALEWTVKPVVVELDCSNLVDAIINHVTDRSPITFLVAEIKDLVNSDRVISIVKVDRTQNRASDCLANFARHERRTMTWCGSGPDCLRQVLDADQFVNPIE